MTETGVIKFQAERLSSDAPLFPDLRNFNQFREKLVRAGLLGRDKHGIGFGNISVRSPGEAGFFITASGAGDRTTLNARDIVHVTNWECARNRVAFKGAADPSSESLTHAAVYEADASVEAVVHAHDLSLWQRLLAGGDATQGSADYGTPAMAEKVKQFVISRKGRETLFAMNGHEGGILCCGRNLESTCSRLLAGKE